MEPLVSTSSVFVAFVGGILALAAPCCVTYLLPAYLASVFRKRRAVLAMTFVFAGGIAVVLMPLVLGAAFLANLLGSFHTEVFIVGGLFLVALGLWSLAGRNLALPVRSAPSGNYDVASVFGLGVFSGAASSCCAPVLAGVLTLSAVSASLPQALLIGSAYVVGMVAPLLVLAYFWDRFELANHPLVRGRRVNIRLGPGVGWSIHSTNLIAGVMFVGIGVLMIVLAMTGQAGSASQAQAEVSAVLTRAADRVVSVAGGVPDVLFALLFVAGTAFLLTRAFPSAAGAGHALVGVVLKRPAGQVRRVLARRRMALPEPVDRGGPAALEETHHG